MKRYSLLLALFITLSGCSQSLRPQQLLADVKELSLDKYEGRRTGSAGNQQAAAYIIDRFKEMGLKPVGSDFKHPFSLNSVSGINLVASVEGKRPDIILVSAHYDHLGVKDGQVYNGADDNASGVAGMLALASHLKKKKPEHTFVFVAFDAEEVGLLGSRAFVANPPVPLELIKLNVNLDMISRADKGTLYVAGTSHFPKLKNYLVFDPESKVKLVAGHDSNSGKEDWTNQSDHFPFYQKGIPFLYFGVEDHPDYHRPTDDFERINPDCFRSVVDLIVKNVTNIDQKMAIQQSFKEKQVMDE